MLDKERNILIMFEGKRISPRWKPRVYIVEEDTLLGFIKRGIRQIRGWYQIRKWKRKHKPSIKKFQREEE